MRLQISQKIVDYDIVQGTAGAAVGERGAAEYQTGARAAQPAEASPDKTAAVPAKDASPSKTSPGSNILRMHEKVERPEILRGSTYKIKTPVSEHAFYITINDFVLNPGTPYEKCRPFEMFINSKNMDHYQWISALTLIVSAVFRKGGDVNFLVKELQSVFDPKGGYFRKGGKFMPSLVAEIGYAIETHLKTIGLLAPPALDKNQRQFLRQTREQYAQQQAARPADAFPPGAQLCEKCHTKAMIVMDNCLTCLNCGESKCG